MFAPLKFIFDYVVERGNLTVVDHGGAVHRFGDGSGPKLPCGSVTAGSSMVLPSIQAWRSAKPTCRAALP